MLRGPRAVTALLAWRDLPTELDGVALSHRARAGKTPVLMVHGVGPGTTGRTNFAPLFDRLSPRLALHLIDLAGFGASGCKAAPPYFDVIFWLRQIERAIDDIIRLYRCPPILIGNSVGGALALKTAAARPELTQVLAIGAAVAPPAPPALRAFWRAPRDAGALAEAMAPMTAGRTRPDPALVHERLAVFADADYAVYFDTMLADPDACLRAVALTPAEAGRLGPRVALMHGREDRACPVDLTLNALLPQMPQADVILLGDCGHNVIAERTSEVLSAITRLVEKNERQ